MQLINAPVRITRRARAGKVAEQEFLVGRRKVVATAGLLNRS